MPKYASGTITRSPLILDPRIEDMAPLSAVSAHGRLTGLVFELTVEQHYRNSTNRNIETVFTFPVPLRAVLLDLELEIGERKLAAQAFARRSATERYERAIDAGDTAALLESTGEGLHTVTIGMRGLLCRARRRRGTRRLCVEFCPRPPRRGICPPRAASVAGDGAPVAEALKGVSK
jgi:hypothetical protein